MPYPQCKERPNHSGWCTGEQGPAGFFFFSAQPKTAPTASTPTSSSAPRLMSMSGQGEADCEGEKELGSSEGYEPCAIQWEFWGHREHMPQHINLHLSLLAPQ